VETSEPVAVEMLSSQYWLAVVHIDVPHVNVPPPPPGASLPGPASLSVEPPQPTATSEAIPRTKTEVAYRNMIKTS
jgi:hypothetical protein